MKTPVLQFGTSRFLQAHADLFFSEASQPVGVTVVQSSGDPTRARRLEALADPGGFPVRIKGIEKGRIIDEERRVTSVKRALSTATDWQAIVGIVQHETSIILSNTGDGGFEPRDCDINPVASQAMSYPAKLYHLLAARYAAGGPVLTIMPMELVPANGQVLKTRVLEIAAANSSPPALLAWLDGLVWVNSLVDRIVSEAIEPAGAVAEPYALWAIETGPGVSAPCIHPNVTLVDDLEKIARLKLHILNLGHTVLAELWRRRGGDQHETVREMMRGPAGRELEMIYREEVLPGFAARGYGLEATRYCAVTVERLLNPFLDHRLSDIFQDHHHKIARRIAAFLAWAGADADMPKLRQIAVNASVPNPKFATASGTSERTSDPEGH